MSDRSNRLKEEGFSIVEKNAERIGRLSDAIYSYSELGFQEYKTAELITKTMAAEGFAITRNVAKMPTAFMATYGSGSPVIGLMADFDGLPGTSQRPTSLVQDPLVPDGPGHGEGHNVGQPAVMGAALAVKALKDKHNLPGTIILFGGPAEELLASRGYMVSAGAFKGVDVMLDVHIGSELSTNYGLNSLAIMSVEWSFTGRSAHGMKAWQGRSALDAVEIMNVSTNYMREHLEPVCRMHYVVTNGGQQPNVVPADASVWYFFRHRNAQDLWEMFARAREAAKGAALATGTAVTERILSASWPFNGNKALAELIQTNLERAGMPKWSNADQAFASAYQTAMGAKVTGMKTEVEPLKKAEQVMGSTDAGDVTWQMPYTRLIFPAKPAGELAGHHWSAGIAPATPLAHKGIATGSKVVVATMIDLMTDPKKLDVIRADFAQQLRDYPKWKSLNAPDAEPPIHLNVEDMARYREALQPFEYDPESSQTYLEFLGVNYPPATPDSAVGRMSNEPKPKAEKSSISWSWEG